MKLARLYKRYKVDLWGLLATRRRSLHSALVRHFITTQRRRFRRFLTSFPLPAPVVIRRRSKRLGYYGRFLHRKQRLKLFYGSLGERQLRNQVRLAIHGPKPAPALLHLLESRLETVLFRAFLLPPGILSQFLSHSLGRSTLRLNGHCLVSRSQRLAPGDILELGPGSGPFLASSPLAAPVGDLPPLLPPPPHLEVNYWDLTLCYAAYPREGEVAWPFPASARHLLEFYRYLGLT